MKEHAEVVEYEDYLRRSRSDQADARGSDDPVRYYYLEMSKLVEAGVEWPGV